MSANAYVKFGALTAIALLTLSGCQGQASEADTKEVTLIVHNSFPGEEFEKAASEATGYDVKVITSAGGQELTTTLSLTKGAPLADAFFGIDNIFASRIADESIVQPYLPQDLSPRTEEHLYDAAGTMVPVTLGATCLNIDRLWFAENSVAEPESYADLIKEEYRGLTVLLDPTSSTTGASFFIGTVAKFGFESALDYWEELLANDARIEQGWSEAYYSQFSAASPDGKYPIVVSYSSSPAYTLNDEATDSATAAVLTTCSSTVEYAGILAGGKNPVGAEAVIDYLLSVDFQDTIADSMYVYPILETAYVPTEWQEFAPLPEQPNDVEPGVIGTQREAWLKGLADRIGL